MTDEPRIPRATGRARYAVAAGFLLLATVGWNVALYGVDLAKRPVPIPEAAEIQDHRLYNFPGEFGTFVLAPEADRLSADDDKLDGIHVQGDDLLETLGTLKHDWNWYYMATYRDMTVPEKLGRRYMTLSITYYTGLLEAVPHVAERCIVASGGRILHEQKAPVDVTLEGLPEAWAEQWTNIKIYRTPWEEVQNNGRTRNGVQDHIFFMNGEPEYRWTAVRWEMGKLTNKYCYFAKVQMAPSGYGLTDEKGKMIQSAYDALCAEFLRQAMPHIVRFLPSAADVRRLYADPDASDNPQE